MGFVPDLEGYLARLGYDGPRAPDLATLNGILAHHIRAIPFENIDVLLGRPIDLEPAAIERKLVHDRRGGYCFEHNTLLLHVLEHLGYEVTPLSARVRIQRPRDFMPARTHMCLRVELDGHSWLADAGVGGLSPACALRIVPDVELPTPHEPRRFVFEGAWSGLDLRAPTARIFHQASFAGAWHDVYEFTLEPMHPIDRVLGNWFTSTHPQSHFRGALMVARATPEGRLTLLDRTLTWRALGQDAQSQTLDSHAALFTALSERFGLRLPSDSPLPSPGLSDLPRIAPTDD